MLERLIERADVMIVNFPPPARERLKLCWEDIEPINPRLVYCSLTGYGETGPDRDRPGFDVTAYFGRSGILDAARYEDGPPGLSLPAQGDRATAMTLVAAILLGLRQRDRTGKGCWVGTSLYANGVWANGTSAAGALVGAASAAAPVARQAAQCADQPLPHQGRSLAAAPAGARRPPVAGPVQGDRAARSWPRTRASPNAPTAATRSLELVKELMPVFAAKTYAEWERTFAGTGIPFGVIGRLADVVEDEQADHAGIFADTTNPEVPRTVNNPIRLGFAQPRKAGPPPAVGQHSEEILREAGFAAAEIDVAQEVRSVGLRHGSHLNLVALVVKEYDPAIDFFVRILRFELVEDVPSLTNDGRPKRWVVVRPPGAATGILIAKADGEEQERIVGNQFAGRVGFFLQVDDFSATYERMVAAGITFVRPPRTEAYGQVAVFLDIAGNKWDLLGPAPRLDAPSPVIGGGLGGGEPHRRP